VIVRELHVPTQRRPIDGPCIERVILISTALWSHAHISIGVLFTNTPSGGALDVGVLFSDTLWGDRSQPAGAFVPRPTLTLFATRRSRRLRLGLGCDFGAPLKQTFK